MNRELWLMRHGKAERYDGWEDYDRPLKKKGKRSAKMIGKWLKENFSSPDFVVSSAAIRAIATARFVCNELDIDTDLIRQEKRIYDEGLTRLKSVLAECPSTFGRVLLVGHNPELEDLLTFLVEPGSLPYEQKLLPTAAVARLQMPEDWSQLTSGCAKLLSIITPAALLDVYED
jgi:phosphohistidine phosphatase